MKNQSLIETRRIYPKKIAGGFCFKLQLGNDPTNGNDGSLSTRWVANDNLYPHWWRVELGTNCNLSAVTTDWFGTGGRSYQYKIEVSTNDINNVVAVDKTGNTSKANTTDIFSALARYVRITVTGVVPTGGNASFYECLVYGNVVPSVSLAPRSINKHYNGNLQQHDCPLLAE